MSFSYKNIREVDHSLEIKEDLPFFRKTIPFQFAARALVFVILLLASMGLFGTGFLSRRTLVAGDTRVQYEFFLRRESQSKWTIQQNSRFVDTTVIRFPQTYLEEFELAGAVPSPVKTEIKNGEVRLYFLVLGSSTLSIFLKPVSYGFISGTIYVQNQHFLLSHFIYP